MTEEEYLPEESSEHELTEDAADDGDFNEEVESQETEDYEDEVMPSSILVTVCRADRGRFRPSVLPQGPSSPVHASIAKAERQRLRQHELQKKKMLEQMREQENVSAAQGDVSPNGQLSSEQSVVPVCLAALKLSSHAPLCDQPFTVRAARRRRGGARPGCSSC